MTCKVKFKKPTTILGKQRAEGFITEAPVTKSMLKKVNAAISLKMIKKSTKAKKRSKKLKKMSQPSVADFFKKVAKKVQKNKEQ